MSDRVLYLHIGLGKCGTSSLQSFLAINSERLALLGFHYPELEPLGNAKSGRVTSGNGALLARSLLAEGHFFHEEGKQERMDRLEAAIRDVPSEAVVISSEFFSMLAPKQVAELLTPLNEWGFWINIVCYLRRQDQMALSTYIQGLIAGHSHCGKSFEEEVADVSRRFRYSRMLAPWVGAGSETKLEVRVFEKSQLQKGDVVDDFLTVLGTNGEQASFRRTKAINQSLNGVSAYLLYLMRKEGYDEDTVRRFVSAAKALDWKGSRNNATLIGEGCRRRILAFLEEDNRKVAAEIAGRASGALFEPSEDISPDAGEPTVPTIAEVLPLLRSCIN